MELQINRGWPSLKYTQAKTKNAIRLQMTGYAPKVGVLQTKKETILGRLILSKTEAILGGSY
jgi:hypothetical protein